MVNIENFIKRLEILLDYYSLNASSFADKIGVQRSSLSHLMSGRNKPSLDFILKILDVFPAVDLYWILKGEGIFPKSEKNQETNFIAKVEKQEPAPIITNEEVKATDLFSESQKRIPNFQPIAKVVDEQEKTLDQEAAEIDKIVIFYKNNTFSSYRPN